MRRAIYKIAKTSIGGIFLGWIFAYFTFVIPGERLAETETLLAFHHPSPSFPLHILIVPRERYKSLMDLPTSEAGLFADLLSMVKELIQRFDLVSGGYHLVVNGGKAQEVEHLHFHLYSEDKSQS